MHLYLKAPLNMYNPTTELIKIKNTNNYKVSRIYGNAIINIKKFK
jgi:hypothetical protein